MSSQLSEVRSVAYDDQLTFIKVLIEESTAVSHEVANVLSLVFDSCAYLMRYSK